MVMTHDLLTFRSSRSTLNSQSVQKIRVEMDGRMDGQMDGANYMYITFLANAVGNSLSDSGKTLISIQ